MADEVFLSTPCRCCLLLEDKDMVYVFDVLDEFGMKISDLIDRNGGIRILENDAFSKHICGNCLNDLAISERFFQRCQKTYDLLMKLISDDAEEEHQILLEDSEILAEAGDENVSYVIVAPGESSALFEDHTSVEENTVVNDDVRQTVDKPEPEILLKEQLEQLEDEDGDEVQIFNDTDHLKECDDIIQEEEINISDELYGQIFKTSLVTQRNNLTDDKDEGDSIVMNSDKKPNDSIMCSGDERSGSKCVNGNMYDFNHSCERCGANFVTIKNYTRHLLLHEIYACDKCLEIFHSTKQLCVHEMKCQRTAEVHTDANSSLDQPQSSSSAGNDPTQQSKPFTCSYCDKRWVSQSALASHQRTHTGERPFACSNCPKRFRTFSSLDLHGRTHTGTKPFPCQVCDKRFTDGSNLKVHMLQHTNEKPHVCTVCNRAFARVFLLQIHMRTHTGEKPFACETCDRRFAQQGDLASHRRIHNGEKPHACEICGKCFIKSGSLAQHRKTHRESNLFMAELIMKSSDEQDSYTPVP